MVPALFVAVTVTVYDVPLVRPVNWQPRVGVAGAVEVEVQVFEPVDEVAV